MDAAGIRKKIQYAPIIETKDFLNKKEQQKMQSIVETYLYYERAVKPAVLTALNDLATYQARPTNDTLQRAKSMLLDSLSTYPNDKIRCYAGNMNLHIESDAAYLVVPGARSRIAGYFYWNSPMHPNRTYAKGYNGPIRTCGMFQY